jgi:hypothetical protein
MTAPIWIVKLVPAVLAVTTGCVRVDSVVLQVMPEIVSPSSICGKILLFAVTAEVLIVSVGLLPVGTATAPAAAEPHTAGDAPLAQLVKVVSAPTVTLEPAVSALFKNSTLPADWLMKRSPELNMYPALVPVPA